MRDGRTRKSVPNQVGRTSFSEFANRYDATLVVLTGDLQGNDYPIEQATTSCSSRLKAHEENSVSLLGQSLRQVVEHTAARRHSRGGDDDGGTTLGMNALRRLDVARFDDGPDIGFLDGENKISFSSMGLARAA